MDHTVHKAMTLQEIAQETKENQPLQAAKTTHKMAIKTSQWSQRADIPVDISSFRIFKTVKDELSVSEDHEVFLRCNRVVIPQSLQQRAADFSHKGYQEFNKTIKRFIKTMKPLCEKVWFPQIDRLEES